jgi:hypothetical protein
MHTRSSTTTRNLCSCIALRGSRGCKKWDQVRLTLKEVGDDEGLMAPMAASTDRPEANVEKAKDANQAASSATSGIDASISKMI